MLIEIIINIILIIVIVDIFAVIVFVVTSFVVVIINRRVCSSLSICLQGTLSGLLFNE